MSKGMNVDGYDCSGLVIASICDVLGIDPQQWPKAFRHVRQFSELAMFADPEPGDLRLFFKKPGLEGKSERVHMGIFVDDYNTIHSSGSTLMVLEGEVAPGFDEARTIPLDFVIGTLIQDNPIPEFDPAII